jgi:methyltransferase (TIGR00027 family)
VIIDDPHGDRFLTPAERSLLLERLLMTLSPATRADILGSGDSDSALDRAVHATPAYAHVLVRARYTEDRLAAMMAHGVHQYVLVGAGLDTFALRRTDLHELAIYELDHAETLALKRDRLARAGIEPPPNVRALEIDLETGSVAATLAASDYRTDAPALFACLGVVGYLTRDANLRLLGDFARAAAPGSELVFDFLHAAAFAQQQAGDATTRMLSERTGTEEPLLTGFDPDRLGDDLSAVGLALVEHLDPARAQARYCSGRADGLQVPAHVHIARAAVAGPGTCR